MAEETISDAASDQLSVEEEKFLLQLARAALEVGIRGDPLPQLEFTSLSPKLIQPGPTERSHPGKNVFCAKSLLIARTRWLGRLYQ